MSTLKTLQLTDQIKKQTLIKFYKKVKFKSYQVFLFATVVLHPWLHLKPLKYHAHGINFSLG